MISVPALAVAEAADADAAVAEKQPNDWYGNTLSVVIPPRLDGSGPPNGALSEGKQTAFCIWGESTDGFSHSGLSSTDEVLCAPGRAWTHRVREDGSLHGREVKLPTPPSTPRCCSDGGGGHRF